MFFEYKGLKIRTLKIKMAQTIYLKKRDEKHRPRSTKNGCVELICKQRK
jgi:nucleoside diphosphate kinase